MEAPDLVGKVLGFRSFDIFDGKLWPVAGQNQPWSLEVNHAVCRHPQSELLAYHHPAPSPECSCGIYANYTLEDIPYLCHFKTRGCVVGAVEMWGRIEAHATGMRAQYAQPILLAIPPRRKIFTRENLNLLVVGPLMGAMTPISAYILFFASTAGLASKAIMLLTTSLLSVIGVISYKLLSAFFSHQKIGKELKKLGLPVVSYQELSRLASEKASPLPMELRPPPRFRDLRVRAKLKRIISMLRRRT